MTRGTMAAMAVGMAGMALVGYLAGRGTTDETRQPQGDATPVGASGSRPPASRATNDPVAPSRQSSAPLPAAFRRVPSNGSGEVLVTTSRAQGVVSALGESLEAAGSYITNIAPLHAVASRDGRVAQASFRGMRDGRGVRGFAVAERDDDGVAVVLMYDTAERFAGSFASLSEAYKRSLPPSSRADAPLERRRLPDGSGALSVPAGWQVTANNSMVSAQGPEGSADLGIWTQAYTPEAAAQFPMRPPIVAPFDPAGAYRAITALTSGIPPQAIEILETAPVAGWDRGPAAMLHVKVDAQGRRLEGLAMVLLSQIGYGQFMYYYSAVGAPAAQFATSLPTLMKIWSSWKVDDRVFQERLRRAAESMREINQIISDVNTNRQQAMDRASTAWDHYIRGTWPVEDTAQGGRADLSGDVTRIVRLLNDAEGYERYREVPFAELNR